MLLKRIDETIAQGLYDLDAGPSEEEVYVAEPSIDGKAVLWEIVAGGMVPRDLLHYDDTPDRSNKFNVCWQSFYVSGTSLGKGLLYSGSSKYFSLDKPNFGGVAKSAIYLRYSRGFLEWLETFDPEVAARLREEIPAFEAMMENANTKKLPTAWYKFKAPRGQWPLISICRLSSGKHLVHWLRANSGESEALEALGIDVARSREIMHFLTPPEVADLELVAEEFQSCSGLGRNAFGKEYKLDAIRESEFRRLMGVIPQSSIHSIRGLWANKLEYRVNVAPSPATSSLLFLPEGDCPYSVLKEVIDGENARKRLFFEVKKKKQKSGSAGNDDQAELLAPPPAILPTPYSTTVFLTHLEMGSQKKRIVQEIVPSVSLDYWQMLNAELVNSHLQYAVVGYMKQALTGQQGDTPSVYRYWTELFTRALQKRLISGRELFLNFQRFCKNQSGKQLIDDLGACSYFRVVGKLLRLQHMIAVARTNPNRLKENEFQMELARIENFDDITTGVFGMKSSIHPPTLQSLLGEAHELLREKEKTKFENFLRMAWSGVPEEDFALFARGALTGMLLHDLCWTVQQQGRAFSATQGRQPSRLRGEELFRVFEKGIGLLMNLEKEQLFNCRLLPFLRSLLPESRRDAFNSGLICGMVYYEKKSDDNKEVKHD